MVAPLTHEVLTGRLGDPTEAVRDWSDAIAHDLYGATRDGFLLSIGLRDAIEARIDQRDSFVEFEHDELEDRLLAKGVMRMLDYNKFIASTQTSTAEEVA